MGKKKYSKHVEYTIEEKRVYAAKFYNEGRKKFEFRPCMIKYLDDYQSVMIFWFSSSSKNENKKYSTQIIGFESRKYPKSYFINTWTRVMKINEIEFRNFVVKDNFFYIKDDNFLEMLLSLKKALVIKELVEEFFKDLKKYEFKIREWIRELKISVS